MTDLSLGWISLVVVLIVLALGVPVAFAMAGIGVIFTIILRGPTGALSLAANIPYSTVASYTMSVLPLFIMIGDLATEAGIVDNLFRAADRWLGRLPGGMAVGAVAACAGFSALSGSSVATAAAIGKVSIPKMMTYGYDGGLATGSVAAAGGLGVLIPPSIAAVVYSGITGVSLGKVLVAGIVPGILTALGYMLLIFITVKMRPQMAPRSKTAYSWKERVLALGPLWGIGIIVVVMIGSIYLGIATPTGSAALGGSASILLFWFTKKINRSSFARSLSDTVKASAMIFVLMIGAYIFVAPFQLSGVPRSLGALVLSAGISPGLVLLGTAVLFIFLGMVMDGISMQLVGVPIVYSAIVSAGFDPVWFGIAVIIFTEIAVLTPPFAMNVFVISALVPEVPVTTIYRGVTPFILVNFVLLLIFTIFPQIILALPNAMKF